MVRSLDMFFERSRGGACEVTECLSLFVPREKFFNDENARGRTVCEQAPVRPEGAMSMCPSLTNSANLFPLRL